MSASASAPASAPASAAAIPSAKVPRAGDPLRLHNHKMFHGKCWTTGEEPDSPANLDNVVSWAKNEYTRGDRGYRLTLWTDAAMQQTNEASAQEGGGPEGAHCTSAVVYRNQFTDDDWEWVEEALCHEGIVTIRFGELSAVLLALRKALQIVSSPAGAHITHVAIYSDNLRVVEWIRDYRKGAKHYKNWAGYFREEIAEVVELTSSMRRIGVQVELAWIPGHAKIEGNVLADHVARRTAGTLPTWPRSNEGFIKLFNAGLEAFERREAVMEERNWAEGVFVRRDAARRARSCKFHELIFPCFFRGQDNYLQNSRLAPLPFSILFTIRSSPPPHPTSLEGKPAGKKPTEHYDHLQPLPFRPPFFSHKPLRDDTRGRGAAPAPHAPGEQLTRPRRARRELRSGFYC